MPEYKIMLASCAVMLSGIIVLSFTQLQEVGAIIFLIGMVACVVAMMSMGV